MKSLRPDPDWWKTLFDEVYLLTDARSVCDDDITRREVDLICELLPVERGHRLLDLCGGHGRHSLELAARGHARCTLVDYSPVLVELARAKAAQMGREVECLQGDARNTHLPAEHFHHVVIMGNSLGYLSEADADREILKEAHRLLRPEGWLLLDVVDGDAVRGALSSHAWHEVGEDLVVCRRREIQGDRMCARELVLLKSRGQLRDRTYSIKLYDPPAVARLMEEAGFTVRLLQTGFAPHRSPGDYGFMNHRIIATGQKA